MGRLQRIEDNDTAFSGMVLRRPTPVTAPPTTINEGAQVSVPTVNPTVSVQPTEQQTASVVQQTGASATVPPVQRQAAPVQQSVPTRQGVTADPRTNPYEYIEQMYGPQETA